MSKSSRPAAARQPVRQAGSRQQRRPAANSGQAPADTSTPRARGGQAAASKASYGTPTGGYGQRSDRRSQPAPRPAATEEEGHRPRKPAVVEVGDAPALKRGGRRPPRSADIEIIGKRAPAQLRTGSSKSSTPDKARRVTLVRRSEKDLQQPKQKVQLDQEPVRLQKALAQAGLGSRRDMDALIEAGRVTVNGQPATPGTRVTPEDMVRVDGKAVRLRAQNRLPRILMYHKQEGELVTRDDPEGRVTVFSRLPRVQGSFWTVVGRLDYNTSGLLLFTTSGDLANRLTHPRFEVEREYAVRVFGELTDEQKKALTTGVQLEDGPARFDVLVDQGGEGLNHWYKVILKEGRNREVRRMFEHFGLTVSRLMRVRFGPLGLPPRLKRGTWAELDDDQVLAIMRWAKLVD